MSDRFDDERPAHAHRGRAHPGRPKKRKPRSTAARRSRDDAPPERRRRTESSTSTDDADVEPDIDWRHPSAASPRTRSAPAASACSPTTARPGRRAPSRARLAEPADRRTGSPSPRLPAPPVDAPSGRGPRCRTGPSRRPARCPRSSPTTTRSDADDLDAWARSGASAALPGRRLRLGRRRLRRRRSRPTTSTGTSARSSEASGRRRGRGVRSAISRRAGGARRGGARRARWSRTPPAPPRPAPRAPADPGRVPASDAELGDHRPGRRPARPRPADRARHRRRRRGRRAHLLQQGTFWTVAARRRRSSALGHARVHRRAASRGFRPASPLALIGAFCLPIAAREYGTDCVSGVLRADRRVLAVVVPVGGHARAGRCSVSRRRCSRSRTSAASAASRACCSRSHDGVGLILGVALCVITYDVVGFFVGSQFGKSPIAPRVSPNKSFEGTLAGMVGSVVMGWLLVGGVDRRRHRSRGRRARARCSVCSSPPARSSATCASRCSSGTSASRTSARCCPATVASSTGSTRCCSACRSPTTSRVQSQHPVKLTTAGLGPSGADGSTP